MSVTPSTVLTLASEVTVRFRAATDVVIEAGDSRAIAGAHGVSIVEEFRTPTPLNAALDRLAARAVGVQDFIAIAAMVNELIRVGILRDAAERNASLGTEPERFDAPRVHVQMLNDRARTASYLAAIHGVVKPGDVVLDIGTGTGVFAVAAAKAGAERVYAVEASSIADAAQRVFDASGFSDRITLIRGQSTQIQLPTRADVLVSEIIGLDPLGERVLETTRDALDRHLVRGARLIPSKLEVYAIPVTLPDSIREGWRFTQSNVERWQSWYEIDFSPLIALSDRTPFQIAVTPRRLHEWTALAEPVRIFAQDLTAIGDPSFVESRKFRATATGRVDAVALYFTLQLESAVTLTTDPRQYREDSHWDHRVWGLPTSLRVSAGDELELTMRHRFAGAGIELRRTGRP